MNPAQERRRAAAATAVLTVCIAVVVTALVSSPFLAHPYSMMALSARQKYLSVSPMIGLVLAAATAMLFARINVSILREAIYNGVLVVGVTTVALILTVPTFVVLWFVTWFTGGLGDSDLSISLQASFFVTYTFALSPVVGTGILMSTKYAIRSFGAVGIKFGFIGFLASLGLATVCAAASLLAGFGIHPAAGVAVFLFVTPLVSGFNTLWKLRTKEAVA